MSVGLVAAAVLGGLVVWPASPAAAESYQIECRAGGIGAVSPAMLEVTGTGPAGPVAAGDPFVIEDLTVAWIAPPISSFLGIIPFSDWLVDVSISMFGQTIELPDWQPTPEEDEAASALPVWGPTDVELLAPDDEGEIGIVPDQFRRPAGFNLVADTFVCTGFGDAPFAFVTVEAPPEPPPNGNGGEPEGNGDDPPGVETPDDSEPARVTRQEIRRVPAAQATPTFTG